MPQYIFSNPNNESEIIEVYQSIHDEHIYIDKDGVKWNRVFTVPQAIIGANIDPFSTTQFMEKTSRPDNMGALWDRSAELSEKRAKQRDGIDPLRVKAEKEYSKKRRGKQYTPKIGGDIDKTVEIDLSKKSFKIQ